MSVTSIIILGFTQWDQSHWLVTPEMFSEYYYHEKQVFKMETGLHTGSKLYLKKNCYTKENFPFKSSKGKTKLTFCLTWIYF